LRIITKCISKFIKLSIDIYWYKHANEARDVVITWRNDKILEKERKERYIETIPETVRLILSDYLRNKTINKWFFFKQNIIINIDSKQKTD
jgi:hypothetical protein